MVRKAGHMGRAWMTYSMGSILGAGKVYHAIDAGKGGAGTAVTVRIKFLLGEDVPAGLLMLELDICSDGWYDVYKQGSARPRRGR